MSYCTNCGNAIETVLEIDPVEEVAQANVEIARIEAERDIALAKIAAKMADSELVTVAAVAVAESDVLSDVVDGMNAPDQNTVVISSDAPEDDEPEPEEEMAEAPPEVDESPAPSSKSNWSYW